MRAAHLDWEAERYTLWLKWVQQLTHHSFFCHFLFSGDILTCALSFFFCVCVCVCVLQFFHFKAVSPSSNPYTSSFFFLHRTETVLTLYYLNPLYFLTARKQKSFDGKKAHLLCLNLLWGITLLLLRLKNQSCILTCLPFTSYKRCWILGSSARFIRGQCRTGKTALFLLLTYWDGGVPETTTDGIS